MHNEQIIVRDLNKEKKGLTYEMLRDFFQESFNGKEEPEEFIKIGDYLDSIPIKFGLIKSEGDSEISKINDIPFLVDALEVVRTYRVVNNEVYQKMENAYRDLLDGRGGEYLVALGDKPMFKIMEESSDCPWVRKPISFEFYDKSGSLSYNPELGSLFPDQIEVKVSVKNKIKGKGFIHMYDKILGSLYKNGFSKVE